MTTPTSDTNPEKLHDLVVAVASAEGTIADHIDLCQQLWQDATHQPWLSAALMRKLSLFERLDEATAGFLAARVQEELPPDVEGGLPDKNTLADALPTLVDLLPEEVWEEPWSAWSNLLAAIHEEYEISAATSHDRAIEVPDEHARAIAAFFAAAVGQPWTNELEDQLRRFVGSPDYSWLVGLQRTGRLMRLLDAGGTVSAESPFESGNLAEQLAAMAPSERSRWLRMYSPSNKKTVWAEPEISRGPGTIEWTFTVPLETGPEINLELTVAQQLVGQIRLLRDDHGMVRIEDAGGLLGPLARVFNQPMPAVRAGAQKDKAGVPVARHLTVSVEPATRTVVFSFCWSRGE